MIEGFVEALFWLRITKPISENQQQTNLKPY